VYREKAHFRFPAELEPKPEPDLDNLDYECTEVS
jgi:hypothetical protein